MGQQVKDLPAMQETKVMWVQSLGVEDPLEKENDSPLQYPCLKIPWTEDLASYSPKSCKELDVTEQLSAKEKMRGWSDS